MGFAVPINLARGVADQILRHGGVRRGTIGITFSDPASGTLRLLRPTGKKFGPVIEKVAVGSAADRAGLRAGDVVTAIDGIAVRDFDQLQSRMGLDWLGRTMELTVSRAGQPVTIRAAAIAETETAQSK